jgi:CarD family transcriptional regulator
MGNLVAVTPITTAMVDAAYGATAAQLRPVDADPFKKGDFVVYPTHGVGKVDRVGSEEIAGHRLDFVYISFEENRMTLRVPISQARTAGLRKLASPAAMADVLRILSGKPRASRLMWAKRAQEFLAKINSGDLKALAEVVRDLHTSAGGAGPSFSQRNLFELALERLAGEFAGVAGTDKQAATDKLTQTLMDGRNAEATRVARVAALAVTDEPADEDASKAVPAAVD